MVKPTRRPLAYAPEPLPGEPLDGWLEHIAHGMGCTHATLRAELGVPIRGAYDLLRGLTDAQASRIADATGVTPARLHEMTLTHYRRWGLTPHIDKRGHGSGTWPRGSGARYCAACLRERDMRWDLRWYLQWSVACTRHERLLLDRCPHCDRHVRTGIMGHPRLQDSATPRPIDPPGDLRSERARSHCPCRVEWLSAADRLTGTPRDGLSHDRPEVAVPEVEDAHRGAVTHAVSTPAALAHVLTAQRVIDDHLAGATTAEVAVFGTRVIAQQWLYDLAALTRAILIWLPHEGSPDGFAPWVAHLGTLAPPHQQPASPEHDYLPSGESLHPAVFGDADLRSASLDSAAALVGELTRHMHLSPMVSGAKRLGEATRSVPAMTLALSAAIGLMSSPDVDSARALLSDAQAAGCVPDPLKQAWRAQCSWPLQKVFSKAGARRSRVDHLEATMRTAPDPVTGERRTPLDPSRVSASLWPAFTDRHPQSFLRNDQGAGAAAAALLTVGSSLSLPIARERLALGHLNGRVIKSLSMALRLDTAYDDTRVIDDLMALHEALAGGHVPIDYTRRRLVFARIVAPSQRALRRFAAAHGLRPTALLRRFMSWYVYELLTGNDVLLGPNGVHVHAPHRLAYRTIRSQWNQHQPDELLLRAEKALLVNRIDEPITWSPVRNDDGTWHCPQSLVERHYAGWVNRPARTHSRSPVHLHGLTIADVVATAAAGQTPQARVLAIKLARFALVAHTNTTEAARRSGITQPTITGPDPGSWTR